MGDPANRAGELARGNARMNAGEERIGLCFTCVHARRVVTPRSTFWLCERSRTDPRYERYPRLPVVRCEGWTPAPTQGAGPD